jgi:Flp pilus assembly protein TadD
MADQSTGPLDGAMAVILETGTAQLRAKKYQQAEMSFRLLLQHCGDHAGLYAYLASALAGLGKWNAAEDAFRKATSLEPETSHLWYNLAYFLAFRQRMGEAKTACAKALKLGPEPDELAKVKELMERLG